MKERMQEQEGVVVLQVERTRIAGQEGLKIYGEVGYENAEVLRRALLQFIAFGHADLALDLEALDYADGGTIFALLSAAELLPPEGELRLLNPNPNVRRLLELTGLWSPPCRCFPIPSSTMEQAVCSAA